MPEPKPRIWPALLVGAGVVPFTWLCAALLLFFVLLVERLPGGSALGEWMDGESATFALAVEAFGEALLVAGLVWLARRSREPAAQRFALGPSRLSVWMLPVVFVGYLAAGALGATLGELAFEEESAVGEYFAFLAGAEAGASLGLLLLVLALLPAITEELLFRGYVQSRLVRRLPAWVAILITSVFFAAAHGEPRYALTVLPAGLWFGFVAWVAGSVWPSMIVHCVGNGLVVLALGVVDESGGSESGAGASEVTPEAATLLDALPALLVLLAVAKLLHWRRRREPVVLPVRQPPLRPF